MARLLSCYRTGTALDGYPDEATKEGPAPKNEPDSITKSRRMVDIQLDRSSLYRDVITMSHGIYNACAIENGFQYFLVRFLSLWIAAVKSQSIKSQAMSHPACQGVRTQFLRRGNEK